MRSFHHLLTTALLAATLCAGCVIAPDALAASPGRGRIDLSGTWQLRFDPADAGENGLWFLPSTRVTSPDWRPTKVPGSFNEEFAAHPLTPDPSDTSRFYKGNVWYRVQFKLAPNAKFDSFLHFAGVALREKVWVNGKLAGESNEPYLDVSYNISSLLQPGENTLAVEVDNRPLPHGIPDVKWRGWWDDGGLIRPVYIEQRPHSRSDTHIVTTMLPANQWQLALMTDVHNPAGATLETSLIDSAGGIVWHQRRTLTAADEHLEVSTALPNINAWSPDHPTLYRLTVTTSVPGQPGDVDTFRVGFRQIEVQGTQVLLNGSPITIRGINRHEFLAGAGMSLSPAQNRADIADLKNLGANFVRLAHYSQSADVYDVCDELGVLVWTEMPAWQTSIDTLRDPALMPDFAVPQLTAIVDQHRNHPSVIIYSVANEIPSDKPEGAAFIGKEIALVHKLDPSRLVTFASDKREHDISMAPEAPSEAPDLIAVNEYFGWYYGKLSDVGPMLDMMHAKYPDKPILVSEYGTEAVAGWDPATAHPDNKGVTKDYSPGYQAKFLTEHMEQIYALSRRSFVAGGVIWVYNDFPDPHRVGGDQPDIAEYRNNKGLVTMDRVRKPAYSVVQAFFHGLASAPPAMATRTSLTSTSLSPKR
ncbi:MAG TPA: glycoside hydrolase family 2 TIM barrel-domain containing protein [Acidobacteriaceae bacterium]